MGVFDDDPLIFRFELLPYPLFISLVEDGPADVGLIGKNLGHGRFAPICARPGFNFPSGEFPDDVL